MKLDDVLFGPIYEVRPNKLQVRELWKASLYGRDSSSFLSVGTQMDSVLRIPHRDDSKEQGSKCDTVW